MDDTEVLYNLERFLSIPNVELSRHHTRLATDISDLQHTLEAVTDKRDEIQLLLTTYRNMSEILDHMNTLQTRDSPSVTTRKPRKRERTPDSPSVTTRKPRKREHTPDSPSVMTRKPRKREHTPDSPSVMTRKPRKRERTPDSPSVTTRKPRKRERTPDSPSVTTRKPRKRERAPYSPPVTRKLGKRERVPYSPPVTRKLEKREHPRPMSFESPTLLHGICSDPIVNMPLPRTVSPVTHNKNKNNNKPSRLTRIYRPTKDVTGLGCHIWDSILSAFERTRGGFVTENDIIEQGGESVFDHSITQILNHTNLSCYFKTPIQDCSGQYMEIRPRFKRIKQ